MSEETKLPQLFVWTPDGMQKTGAHDELSYVTRQAHELAVSELRRELSEVRLATKKPMPTMEQWENFG